MLVIGSGGREHAITWKLAQSQNIGLLFVAPGNAGTAEIAENVPILTDDIPALIKFAKANAVDLTIVGPDNALAQGIVDAFQQQGLRIFGPTKKAAAIEWSKTYAKKLMKKYDIPTAEYAAFSSHKSAQKYLQKALYPVVVKADGLALGKGVFICQGLAEAKAALKTIMKLGQSVVIEEFLEGIEISAHAICDGENFILLPLSQDHKRIGEGNTGPNTGGMGTICPVPGTTKEIDEIITKTLKALKKEGREFSGCLFPGIMLTKGGPKVLEFNARFGDPETQVYLRLLESDLLLVLEAAVEKRLAGIDLKWQSGAAACVVLASKGYPGNYSTGINIEGIAAATNKDTVIFHAGTKSENGKTVTAGGRVLNVTATGSDLIQALKRAYQAVEMVSFQGITYRRDIGFQLLD